MYSIEDPDSNRLTDEGVFIDVLMEGEPSEELSNKNSSVVGYWYNTREEDKHVPLYTKYQPQHCRGEEEKKTLRCKLSTDLTRFDAYNFRFTDHNFSPEILNGRLRGQEAGHKVCIVGFSHSRVLNSYLSPILSRASIKTIWVKVRFARDFNKDNVKYLIQQQCTKVVIGFGQWDAGFPKGFTSFPNYEQSLVQIVKDFQEELQMLNETEKKMDIFFRSTQ